MIKAFYYFLNKLKPSEIKERNIVEEIPIIPNEVSDEENVVRAIFEPNDIAKKTNTLKYIAFRSPPERDEVSVTRLQYSTPTFCKSHAKSINRQGANYFGLAVINVLEIRNTEINGDVVSTPMESNPAHADIKIGFIPLKGEQLPSEIRYRLDKLADKARLYPDKNKEISEWIGD